MLVMQEAKKKMRQSITSLRALQVRHIFKYFPGICTNML